MCMCCDDAMVAFAVQGVVHRGPSPSPSPASPSACTTDADCSLNGVCEGAAPLTPRGNSGGGKTCVCDPQWKGPSCSVLNLVPVSSVAPAYPPPSLFNNTTSWGGSVVKDVNDGTYHMFAAEMAGKSAAPLSSHHKYARGHW